MERVTSELKSRLESLSGTPIDDPVSDNDFTGEDVERMSSLAGTDLVPFGVIGLELLLLGDNGMVYLENGESLQILGNIERAADVLKDTEAPIKCWYLEDEDEWTDDEEGEELNTAELRKQIDADWEKRRNDPNASPHFLEFCNLLDTIRQGKKK